VTKWCSRPRQNTRLGELTVRRHHASAASDTVKQKHHISIRRIALLTLLFLVLLVIAYAAVQPPRLTQYGAGILDLPIDYLLSLFLPTYTATFAVAAGLWLQRRLRRGEKISYSWIALT